MRNASSSIFKCGAPLCLSIFLPQILFAILIVCVSSYGIRDYDGGYGAHGGHGDGSHGNRIESDRSHNGGHGHGGGHGDHREFGRPQEGFGGNHGGYGSNNGEYGGYQGEHGGGHGGRGSNHGGYGGYDRGIFSFNGYETNNNCFLVF